jgi:hypothetical protein
MSTLASPPTSNPETTFQDRLKAAIGMDGYKPYKRRSIQTVLLYETHRAVSHKLPALRPFQRKIAVFVEFNRILKVECAGFLMPHQRAQILWTTATSRKPVTPDGMMKRMRLAVKEVEDVAAEVKTFVMENETEGVAGLTTHEEVYNAFLRHRFVSVSAPHWLLNVVPADASCCRDAVSALPAPSLCLERPAHHSRASLFGTVAHHSCN